MWSIIVMLDFMFDVLYPNSCLFLICDGRLFVIGIVFR